MNNFYLNNSSNESYLQKSFFEDIRDVATKHHSKLLTLEQANQLNLQQFFVKNEGDISPHLSREYHYLTIPYELSDGIFPDNEDYDVCTLLSPELNRLLVSKPIYLASTDNDKCCVVECPKLSTELIYVLGCGYHINTPFLIFNQDADIFALIDYDLPLQIIGYKPHLKVEIEHYDVIQQGFNDVMQRYGSYTNMPNLFRTYYDFLLPEWFEY